MSTAQGSEDAILDRVYRYEREHEQDVSPTLATPGEPGWNGLAARAWRGTAVVADTPDMPQHWVRTEGIIRQRIAVVKVDLNGVNAGGGVVYLDDREGQGSYKVFERAGSPRVGHREVPVVAGSFEAAE